MQRYPDDRPGIVVRNGSCFCVEVFRTPLVSIIVPVYNCETYIKECLDSICKQSWYNLEILVVNDGSLDESLQTIREIAEREPRITVIDLPHRGVSSARNAGIKNVSGEYLTFVDADDLVEQDYIEHMVNEIGDTDFCMTGFQLWEQDEDQWIVQNGITAVYRGREICDHIQDYHEIISGIGWRMYRTSFFRENNLMFPEEICLSEDTLLFSRVLLCADKAAFISDPGYIIRKNMNSLTRSGIFSIEMTDHILKTYGELASKSTHPVFIQEMLYRQFEEIGWACKKICYHIKGHRKRKDIFLALVDGNSITAKQWTGKPHNRMEMMTRMLLTSRTFFPYYLVMKTWCFIFPQKRKGFIGVKEL